MGSFLFNKHFLEVEIEGKRYRSLEGLGQNKLSDKLIVLGEKLKDTNGNNLIDTLQKEAENTIDGIFGEGSYKAIFETVDADIFNILSLVEFLSNEIQKTTHGKLDDLNKKYTAVADLKDE